jgi:hypothetical protein
MRVILTMKAFPSNIHTQIRAAHGWEGGLAPAHSFAEGLKRKDANPL